MSETNISNTAHFPSKHDRIGANLAEFVYGCDEDNTLDLEVAIKQDGRVILFHNRPFKKSLDWFEFSLKDSILYFVVDDGKEKGGIPVTPNVAPHMQNTYQILTILLDNETGEAKEGKYIPLMILQ